MSWRRWVGGVIVAGFATLFQVLAASNSPTIFTWDSPSYIEPARMLACCGRFMGHDPISYSAEAGSFPEGPLRADTVRTPVYPGVLAVIFRLGGSLHAVIVFQRALIIVFSVLLYRFLEREFGPGIAAVATLLYTLWPSLLDAAGLVMTEAIASILIAVAVGVFYLAQRQGRTTPLVIAGLLFGVATLARPIVLYLPLLLLSLLIVRRVVRRRAIAAFAIAAALLPVAWASRNYARAGAFVVSSIEGENLLMYRAAGVLTVKDMPATSAIFALQQQFGYFHTAIRMRPELARQGIAAATRDGIPSARQTHAVLSRYYRRLAVKTILDHPLAYALLATSSFIELYFEPLATRAAVRGMNPTDASIRFVPIAIALFGFAIFGAVRLYRLNRDAAFTTIVVLIYFTVVSAGPEVGDRFLVPFLSVYAVAIATGMVGLGQQVRLAQQRRQERLIPVHGRRTD